MSDAPPAEVDPDELPDAPPGVPDPDGVVSGPEAPGVEPDETGESGSMFDALMATEPNPALEDVDSPWNPEDGGLTRVKRGFQKITGYDAMPAALDITIGLCEWYVDELADANPGLFSSEGGNETAEDMDQMARP